MKRSNKKGFTIVELVIVIAVALDIRKYIIDRYGSGCFSPFEIRLRQAVILSRCAWQLVMPLHAAYYFFATLLGIVHGKQ